MPDVGETNAACLVPRVCLDHGSPGQKRGKRRTLASRSSDRRRRRERKGESGTVCRRRPEGEGESGVDRAMRGAATAGESVIIFFSSS